MALQLAPEEREAGPWQAERLEVVIAALTRLGRGRRTGDRSVVLAVDGRSSSGKSTLAGRVQAAVEESAVVHTDDLAWWHSRFGWSDLLVDGILMPVHRGERVTFRPPRWAEHGREGSIDVPVRSPLLIIDGVGAGRREAARLVDALVWVQSDQREGERGTCVSGWPKRSIFSLISGRGTVPISLSPVPRRSPSTRAPNSLSAGRRPGWQGHDHRAVSVHLAMVIDGQRQYLPGHPEWLVWAPKRPYWAASHADSASSVPGPPAFAARPCPPAQPKCPTQNSFPLGIGQHGPVMRLKILSPQDAGTQLDQAIDRQALIGHLHIDVYPILSDLGLGHLLQE